MGKRKSKNNRNANKVVKDAAEMKSFFAGFGSYISGLSSVDLPANIRARDPVTNHPWVFAAAAITAIVASQAPYTTWVETKKTEEDRKTKALRLGRKTGNKAGKRRRAMMRHDIKNLYQRVAKKGIEKDEDNPILELIENPNSFQDSGQLWFITHFLLAAEGAVLWVFADDNGQPTDVNPTQIFPFKEEFFTEVLDTKSSGKLIGYEFSVPSWMSQGHYKNKVFIPLTAVVHFKFPNPNNPFKGLSRLTSAASAIESSLLARAFNRSTLQNSGVPKGVLTYKGAIEPAQRKEFQTKWAQKFEGPENQGHTAILSDGFTYQTVALTPQELQFENLTTKDREEILATMNVPKTVLGLTDAVNFATSQGQDRNFWDKGILPLLSIEEKALDRSLFYTELDNVFGAFDLSAVESLRIGLEAKVELADKLCLQNLHMPPTMAFTLVGIEVEQYEGDDVCLVSSSVTTVTDALIPMSDRQPEINDTPGPLEDGSFEDDSEAEEVPEHSNPVDEEENTSNTKTLLQKDTAPVKLKEQGGKIWRDFIKVQEHWEEKIGKKYKSWVRDEKKLTLARFEAATKELKSRLEVKEGSFNISFVIGEILDSINSLKGKTRALYSKMLEDVYQLTLAELGQPLFTITDPSILSFFDDRQDMFTSTTTGTLAKNLKATLEAGTKANESTLQLRMRIEEVYNTAISDSKTFFIARQESAGFMNGLRDKMFGLQGVTQELWQTEEDLKVRHPHTIFGDSGPRQRDFNYLELVGEQEEGVLTHPHDLRAPLKQTAGCRCIKLAVS